MVSTKGQPANLDQAVCNICMKPTINNPIIAARMNLLLILEHIANGGTAQEGPFLKCTTSMQRTIADVFWENSQVQKG